LENSQTVKSQTATKSRKKRTTEYNLRFPKWRSNPAIRLSGNHENLSPLIWIMIFMMNGLARCIE
jgi:hypothetical protein